MNMAAKSAAKSFDEAYDYLKQRDEAKEKVS